MNEELTDPQIRQIAKCRNACIWLLGFNLFVVSAPLFLGGAGIVSQTLSSALDKPLLALHITYCILALVLLWRLARAGKCYGVLLYLPLIVLPCLGWVGFVPLYKKAERLLGNDPARLPARHGLRRCPCGGVMAAVAAQQWVVRNWGGAPAGYEVQFRCRSCGKSVTIQDDVFLAIPALVVVLLLPLMFIVASGLV
ncbi:MAG: hypothetical protein NTW03_01040, partial [Verrucomicrobia bacterium]|nr:hypothetical protein [Verrucomicrobiota bacterium]